MNEINAGKSYVQNDMFRAGDDFHANACVGDNGGPYQLNAYAEGYMLAASSIVEATKEMGHSIDIMIYPICYNFRHGIECYLKYFRKVLPRLLDVDSANHPNRAPNHKLIDDWREVKSLVLSDPIFEATNSIDRIDAAIKDFLEIDPFGEAFRFPEARDGTRYLTEMAHINVNVLNQAMKKVYEIFRNWANTAYGIADYKYYTEPESSV